MTTLGTRNRKNFLKISTKFLRKYLRRIALAINLPVRFSWPIYRILAMILRNRGGLVTKFASRMLFLQVHSREILINHDPS